jgi:hypothetical protein
MAIYVKGLRRPTQELIDGIEGMISSKEDRIGNTEDAALLETLETQQDALQKMLDAVQEAFDIFEVAWEDEA